MHKIATEHEYTHSELPLKTHFNYKIIIFLHKAPYASVYQLHGGKEMITNLVLELFQFHHHHYHLTMCYAEEAAGGSCLLKLQ